MNFYTMKETRAFLESIGMPGGDLYDRESRWFSLTDSRPDTYVTDWLETVDCPVIRIDGTLPVEQNVDNLVSVLSEEND